MSSMAANPYGPPRPAPLAAAPRPNSGVPISGAHPLISLTGPIGDVGSVARGPAVNPLPYAGILTPAQRLYSTLTDWGHNDIPRGPNALRISYEDPFHPVVTRGPTDPNIDWTWASPADYRGWAKAQLAARAAAAKTAAAKTVATGGGATAAGTAASGTINPGGPMIPYYGAAPTSASSLPLQTAPQLGAMDPGALSGLAAQGVSPTNGTYTDPTTSYGLNTNPVTSYGLAPGTQINSPRQPAGGAAGTTTAQTAAASTPSGQTIPNYQQLILSDPIYHQATQDALAQGVQDENTRSASTQTALTNFGDVGDIRGSLASLGLDPSSALYQNLLSDADAAAPQAAALTSAGLSTTAGLARDHATNIDDLLQRAANTGTVESGYTGASLGNEDQRYSGAQYTARANVVNYLAGVQAAYLASQQSSRGTLSAAASAAAARVAQLYPVAPNYGSTGAAATALGQTGGGTPAAPAAPAPVPYFPRGTGAPAPRRRVVAPNVRQIGRNR